MKRLPLAVICAAVLLSPAAAEESAPSPSAKWTTAKLAASVRYSVVTISARGPRGNPVKIAGFIRGGRIITCRMPLAGAEKLAVTTTSGSRLGARAVAAENEVAGLLALKPTGTIRSSQNLDTSLADANEGDKVFVVTPDGKAIEAEAKRSRTISIGGTVLEISAHVPPEANGSPVVNERGQLVGVAVSGVYENRPRSFAVSTEVLENDTSQATVRFSAWSAKMKKPRPGYGSFLKGLTAHWAGDYQAANYYYGEAAQANPEDPVYLHLLGATESGFKLRSFLGCIPHLLAKNLKFFDEGGFGLLFIFHEVALSYDKGENPQNENSIM